ncbi:uncharacterized protein V6R79_015776 [Siganus canaliculatus]
MKATSCWFLGDLLCALYFLLSSILIAASISSMVLISIDRYIAICYPLQYPIRMPQKIVSIYTSVIWLFSVLISFIFYSDHLMLPGRYNSCHGECVVNIAGLLDLIGFVAPISIIVVLYIRVFVVAMSQARAMRSQVATNLTKKSELKAARNLGVLVLVFLICYCPYYGASLSGGEIQVGSSTESYMACLLYFNSCLNPIIYAMLYPWFRKALKLIVTLQILQPDSCDANMS